MTVRPVFFNSSELLLGGGLEWLAIFFLFLNHFGSSNAYGRDLRGNFKGV